MRLRAVALLAALTLCAVTVLAIMGRPIPALLGWTLTALIGGHLGLSYPSRPE